MTQDEQQQHEQQKHEQQQHEQGVSFTAFVWSLATTAALHFGDLADPETGKTGAPNLPAAQHVIDLLAMLETKTRGNLTAEERQFLEQLLYELRMRFIELQTKGAEVPPSGSRTSSGIIIP